MINSLSLFEQTQLAEAAYASFGGETGNQKTISDALQNIDKDGKPGDEAFSKTQAEEFLKHWRVADQYATAGTDKDNLLTNKGSGFSATLFESLDRPGEYTFAIRGSIGANDFKADLDLIFNSGIAAVQIVDMVNYWQSLITPEGQTYRAAKLTVSAAETASWQKLATYPGKQKVYERALFAKNAIIVEGMVCYLEFCDSGALPEESKELRFGRGLIKETPAHLNVAGHSLGGHLAMAFNRLFPQMNVDTLAVNGLGFKFNHGSVNNLFSQLNGAWQFNASRIENVYGLAGPEFASMNNGILQQPGGWDGLFIEDGWGHVSGHSATQMTDSAAVYDLFVRLDAGLAAQSSAEALKSLLPLFEAGSGDNSQTLETLVKNLYKIVLGIEPQITKNNRESLYAHLFALQNSDNFKALSGKATVALLTAGEIETQAARKDDIGLAYRYALRELNPFALIGADYSAHNSDGSLDLYDEATGKGAMSEAYLQDRAAMLAWKIRYGQEDKAYDAEYNTNKVNGNWDFVDKATGMTLAIDGYGTSASDHQIVFGGAGAEEIAGGTESDRLYGGGGNDTLQGDGGDDYLEGGQGDDQLIGGAGADTLNGGAGNDTYLLDDKDDAIDTIEDADGKGSLIINGTVLQGGEAAGKGRWINKTQGTVFTLLGQGEHSTLIIQNEARPGQIYLRNWKNGQLGLTMAEAPVPEEIQRTTYDLSLKEDKNAYKSIQPEQAGNLKIINAIDVARGGLVGGYGGEDLIVGGTAARPNYAAILDGSSGSDIVWAGEQKTSIQQAMADGETETSNGRNNVLLNGHVGDDQLIGDAGHDVLFGGEGHDTLVGGAGADIIIADGEGIGLNTGGTSSEFAWALGGDPDQISSLHLHMGVAMVETAKADSTGRKLRAIHNIGMTVSPLANTDMSGLLSMEAKEQADGSVIWTKYADLHGGHYFGTNVGKGNDVIYAGAGNDAVNAGAGNDFVQAGSGKDQVAGYEGNDFILGDTGDDLIWGDAPLRDTSGGVSGSVFGATWTSKFQLDAALHGQDILDGGEGNDTLIGGGSRDVLWGGAGNDTLVGDDLEGLADGSHTGDDFLDGGDGNDVLFGDDSVEQPANARGGNDTLIAGMGEDVLYGGNGNDILNASEEDNAADDLYGEAGDDTLYGGTGADTLDGGEGNDHLYAGKSGSFLIGGEGNDYLHGGEGNDTLQGDAGNDVFYGGQGNDQLNGGDGNDTLDGGAGNDYLEGGNGADTYRFGFGSGQDTVGNADALGVNPDAIELGAGITADKVRLTRQSNDLIVGLAGTNDSLRVSNYFRQDDTSSYAIERIKFADGTNWDIEEVKRQVLVGTSGDDRLYGFAGADTLNGGEGDDALYGYAGADSLNGGMGDDQLNGGDGDDTLEGGEDYDTLEGGNGADTYRFGIGSGQDTINNYDADALGVNPDVIELGAGITVDKVRLARQYDDLIVSLIETNDSLRVSGYFYKDGASPNAIERIKFADGTSWDIEEVKRRMQIGTAGGDELYGYAGNDYLNGGAGNDTLYGGGGNDILEGGEDKDRLHGGDGDDTLEGGEDYDTLEGGNGADTYRFGIGSGYDMIYNYDADAPGVNPDTIELGAGITPDKVRLTRQDEELVVNLIGTKNSLYVSNYFYQDGGSPYAIDRIKFADGTSWDIEEVKRRVQISTEGNDKLYGYAGDDYLNGGAGNDRLYGEGGNDTLEGGEGNDTLDGGNGADTYRFGMGSGQDTVYNSDADALGVNPDVIELGAGITADKVCLTRQGNDLIVSVNGTNDSLRVSNYFYKDGASSYAVERIKFADGTSWDIEEVKRQVQIGTEGNDELYGYAGDDHLNGRAGNDRLYGEDGNDTLDGGAGNDKLYGGNGNDTYLFGRGDGKDIIDNSSSDKYGNSNNTEEKQDVLLFKQDIRPEDVSCSRVNEDLLIRVGNTNDQVLVQKYFSEKGLSFAGYTLDLIKFADGTSWDFAQIKQKVQSGTIYDDILNGDTDNNVLFGNAGNDILDGKQGDDTLIGGAGDDTIHSNMGSDVIIYNQGDGNDTVIIEPGTDMTTIKFGDGIDISDLEFSRRDFVDEIQEEDYSLFTQDPIKVGSYTTTSLELAASDLPKLKENETLSNHDGSSYGKTYFSSLAMSQELRYKYYGNIFNPVLDDYKKRTPQKWEKDPFEYLPWKGAIPYNDNWYLAKTGKVEYRIKEKKGVSSDLVVSLKGSNGSIKINDFLGGSKNQSKAIHFKFNNGESFSYNELLQIILNRSATDKDDVIHGFDTDDVIIGGAGDDNLQGGQGDDTLEGGLGNDTLVGSSYSIYWSKLNSDLFYLFGYGNDTYIFAKGDGQDIIYDMDHTPDNQDSIVFKSDISLKDLVFSKKENDLIILNNHFK